MLRKFFVTGLSLAICAAAATDADAQNGRKAVGTLLGIGGALGIMNEAAKALNSSQTRPPSGGRPASRDETAEPRDRDARKAADPEALAQATRILAALEAELQDVQRAERQERDRNVDTAIGVFLDDLVRRHQVLVQNDKGGGVRATRGEINQVTAGQIKASIEDAYGKSSLREFDKYTGELWTRDRLLVRLLRTATKRLTPYFQGVGAKGPSMDDLKDVFEKSARDVYAQALETNEIVGVSKSYDRFIRTVYENSEGLHPSLLTNADGQYEQLTVTVIDGYWRRAAGDKEQTVTAADPQALDRQFIYRFRARRVLYDCLTGTFPTLTRGDGLVETSSVSRSDAGGRRQPVALSPAINRDAWEKVRGHVEQSCQGAVPSVLAQAVNGGVLPVSSRDGVFSNSTFGSRLTPVGNRN